MFPLTKVWRAAPLSSPFFFFLFFLAENVVLCLFTLGTKSIERNPHEIFYFLKKIGTWSPDVFFFPIIRKGINAVLTLFSEPFFCYWLSFGESVVLKILGVWPLLRWTNQLLTSCFKFSLGTWKFRISNSASLNVKACLHMR